MLYKAAGATRGNGGIGTKTLVSGNVTVANVTSASSNTIQADSGQIYLGTGINAEPGIANSLEIADIKNLVIIGSGPAGLAAAQQLNRVGHEVVVFERSSRIGGLLRFGIPDFKLEKHVVQRRVDQMQAEGVSFITGVEVGKSCSAKDMVKKFDALCLTGGSTKPRDLSVPGRELSGIHFAMEYLAQQNRVLAGQKIPDGERITAEGKRVVILGGGDTGADCLAVSYTHLTLPTKA